MGWHWVDSASPEFHGQPFTSTFVYGYYNGKMNFLEPMADLSFLEDHPHFSATVKEPEKVTTAGWYPAQYKVRFNSAADSYEVLLTRLHFREVEESD